MFYDRYDAGQRLASQLTKYKGAEGIIYALPRGGVLVGLEVAKVLHMPLELVITRKIGHPLNDEYAICAITEDGKRVCDERGMWGVDDEWINSNAAAQMKEANRRRKIYRHDKAMQSPAGKIAIIVDDGIATGLTMKAAIMAIKAQKPSKIVVAVPVAPREAVEEIQPLVDDMLVGIDDTAFRGSVGSYYTQFPEIHDREVNACMQQAEHMFTNYKIGNNTLTYEK